MRVQLPSGSVKGRKTFSHEPESWAGLHPLRVFFTFMQSFVHEASFTQTLFQGIAGKCFPFSIQSIHHHVGGPGRTQGPPNEGLRTSFTEFEPVDFWKPPQRMDNPLHNVFQGSPNGRRMLPLLGDRGVYHQSVSFEPSRFVGKPVRKNKGLSRRDETHRQLPAGEIREDVGRET